MEAADAKAFLVIPKADFLKAIRTIKPRRVTKTVQLSNVQLGHLDREAVFCVNGAEARCPARGRWPGLARFPFAYLLSLLKVPPKANPVLIEYDNGKLIVETSRISAGWAEVSEWVGSMALEAHLQDLPPEEEVVPLYCPRCGRRKGVPHNPAALQSGRYPMPEEGLIISGSPSSTKPTHECEKCGHRWVDLG